MDFQKPESLATRASLLERLKDLDDQESWQVFYATYRRLIFSFAVKHGLTGAEAEEVVQETVISVARHLREFQYDPKRCAFKTWLFNLTLWRIRDQLRKRPPGESAQHRKPGETDRTSTAERLPGPESEHLAALWEEEWKQDVFERALERVKTQIEEKQFQIFDFYVLRQWPARKVAQWLGVSLVRVYFYKHHISKLMRAEIERLQESGQ